MLLKYNIDQDKDCILRLPTVKVEKKIKELIKKDELTIADLEGAGLEMLKRQYKNYVELEYHVDHLKAAMAEEAQWSNEMGNRSTHKVSSDKRIITVVSVDVKKKWGHVQGTLHHLKLEFEVDFINAPLLYIKRVVIKNMIEDTQLGVESYQRTPSLTKPKFYFSRIDHKTSYTTTRTQKGVVYLNKYDVKSLIQRDEVHKFYDAILLKVKDNLLKRLKENSLGHGNVKLEGREWTKNDIKRLEAMLEKIDKTLKQKQQRKRLE
nr:hypothetical protein [Tanacetum cinerariifolium]